MNTPMLIDVARYVLAFVIFVSVAALCVGIAIWASGRHSDDPHAARRGVIGIRVAVIAVIVAVLLFFIYLH